MSAAATPSRMSMSAVSRGKRARPVCALVYGVEGVGKSSFAADAPKPIFVGAEDGTSELDVERMPEPRCWADVLDAITALATEKHDRETVVFDTLDWLEPLLHEEVCRREDVKGGIEGFGYGKGYVKALDEWRVFVTWLDELRAKRRMNIILLAHSCVRTFKNPEGEDFDRYMLKMNEKSGALLKEWADSVLFANYQTLATKATTTKKAKAINAVESPRYLHTQRRAAWDAKNRFGLPERLPLSWADFWAGVQASRADVAAKPDETAALVVQIRELAGKLGEPEAEVKINEWLAKPQTQENLRKQLDRLAAKTAEKEVA